jgi:protein TonB
VPQVQPPAPTPVKPRPEPVRAVPPPPQPVQRQVETRVVPQAIQREVQPVVETVRPQEQIQPTREVVQVQAKPLEPQEIQKTEPLMQAAVPAEVVRETAAAVEQTVVEAAPVTAQTYQAQAVVSAPAVMETRPEPIVTASAPVVQAAPASEPAPPSPAPAVEAVASVSEPAPAPPSPAEPVAAAPAPAAAAQPDPATLQEHQVVARVATPRPATKADYGWLAESLHRRIIELRHYPSTARLNGWEGKVVLKVSIRNDGQLKDVEVVKSSGHESLDQAAMEAVRRACPLHMKHELTAPMVVLHLPGQLQFESVTRVGRTQHGYAITGLSEIDECDPGPYAETGRDGSSPIDSGRFGSGHGLTAAGGRHAGQWLFADGSPRQDA